ncbi:MAG: BON domain-containing protein [Pigmentiphaga sp.]|uniref:BON domain-containing protein n=1 Tax=Pigmentiphaga sp. TaxID=1977564 RepID=UPI0029BBA510|nr:BON domain-containing protein [Pigmentiphaga sp.]MDX3906082.1 BON domain-containing protein [Pigmentiphaga sp.]
MKHLLNYVAAAALGATAMYLFDPIGGRRRRALLRDKAAASRHDLDRYARKARKRAADQLHGVAARARSTIGMDGSPVDEWQLVERVRSHLGRVTSHPGSIDVSATAGQVCLSGQILASEHEKLIAEVSAVPGVDSVEDRLEVHEHPGFVPELQGASKS